MTNRGGFGWQEPPEWQAEIWRRSMAEMNKHVVVNAKPLIPDEPVELIERDGVWMTRETGG